MRLITKTLLFAAILTHVGCSDASPETRPLLIQNYRIQASNDATSVEGTVSFRERLYEAEKSIDPSHIEVNGSPLSKTALPSYTAPTFRHLLRKDAVDFEIHPMSIDSVVDGFSGSLTGFVNKFNITVVGNSEAPRQVTLEFDPIVPAATEVIQLSRKRINEIAIRGRKDDSPILVFNGAAGRVKDDEIRFDFVQMKIIFPGHILNDLAAGPQKLSIISGENGFLTEHFIDATRVENKVEYVSSYIFTAVYDFDVVIVD